MARSFDRRERTIQTTAELLRSSEQDFDIRSCYFPSHYCLFSSLLGTAYAGKIFANPSRDWFFLLG